MSRALFFAGLALVLAGGAAALLLRGRRGAGALFAAATALGCILVAGSAVMVLGGAPWELRLQGTVPGGAWVFGADALSAWFLLPIAFVGGCAAVYGVGALRGERPGAAGLAHAGLALLLAAMALLVTARAAVPFLVAWEVMALAAFLLVMYDHELADTRRAGLVYLAATHTATLGLVAMFAAWAPGSGDLTFAALAVAAARPAFPAALILALALAGFGLKAGLVPLHFWLPGAHAAAPSHVSAVMSGLLIKTGIYGLLRVAALIGGCPAWFGWTLLVLGVSSGVLGVVWALAQHDLKRLLAYHSVENIGIILIGMGVGALGVAYRVPAAALLGYGGAVLHVLNHAVFKSLLFLGAGAVAHGAGTRRIDALGGLARAMPVTFAVFLVASAAIVGLPPLNGFVSEWTIVLALLSAAGGHAPGALRVAILGVAALGLIGGLALACFAKVNGAVFLGRPRTSVPDAHEASRTELAPMVALALACVAIGVASPLVLPPALAAAAVVTGSAAGGAELLGAVQPVAGFAFALALALLVAWLVRQRLMRRRFRVVAAPWGCGYPLPTARMQYTAASFAAPVLEPLGPLAGIRAEQEHGAFATHPFDPALHGLIVPGWRRVQEAAALLRAYQTNRLHIYLLYVLATVLVLLGYLALRETP